MPLLTSRNNFSLSLFDQQTRVHTTMNEPEISKYDGLTVREIRRKRHYAAHNAHDPTHIATLKETFLTPLVLKHIESLEKAPQLPIEQLRERLRKLKDVRDLDKYRVMLFALSCRMSRAGIAPQWQGLQEAARNEQQVEVIKYDSALFDLYWLSINFPNHETNVQEWNSLFMEGFNMGMAIRITRRSVTRSRLINKILKLSELQQLGCFYFCSKNIRSEIMRLRQKADNKSNSVTEREKERAVTIKQIKQPDIDYRATIFKAWVLARESPTKAAKIYQWMTGKAIDKGTINRTVNRVKTPVKRAKK